MWQLRKALQDKLADPRLATVASPGRPGSSSAAGSAASDVEAIRAKAAQAKAEVERVRAELEAEERQAAAEAAALARARAAGRQAVADQKAKEGEAKRREQKRLEEEKRREEKRLEEEAKAKASAADAARAKALLTASGAAAAAAEARAALEESAREDAERRKQAMDEQERVREEELRKARESMQRSYGADWGADDGGGGGGGESSSSAADAGGAADKKGKGASGKYGPADGTTATTNGGLKRKGSKFSDDYGGGGGLCGGNKQALRVMREELDDTRKELEEATRKSKLLEVRNKDLREKALQAQEKAARDIAELRTMHALPDESLLPRLRAAETEKAKLLEQIEVLLVSQEEAVNAATAAQQAASQQAAALASAGTSRAAFPQPPELSVSASSFGGRAGGDSAAHLPFQRSDTGCSSQSPSLSSFGGSGWMGGSSSSLSASGGGGGGGGSDRQVSGDDAKVALRLRTKGTLRVHMRFANNLMAADRNGKSDPYVKVTAGGKTLKTKVIKESLDPEWNQDLDFKGTLNDFVRQGLTLRFMDSDFGVMNDDLLGEMEVPLDVLRPVGSDMHTFESYPLPTQGTVTFDVHWAAASSSSSSSSSSSKPSRLGSLMGISSRRLSKSSDLGSSMASMASLSQSASSLATTLDASAAEASIKASAANAAKLAAAVPHSGSAQVARTAAEAAADPYTRVAKRGRLIVHLLSAKGLLSADSNGLSDPYCKVTCLAHSGGRIELVTRKSKTIYKSLNPTWNQELSFEGTLQSFLSYGLMVRVIDYDQFSSDGARAAAAATTASAATKNAP